MKKIPYIFETTIILLCGWILSGCVKDDLAGHPPTGAETAEVSISIRFPGSPGTSRALDGVGENKIDDIVILVFDGDDFQYRADAQRIDPTSQDRIKTFDITLRTGPCDLWVLANCRSILDAYTIPNGATKNSLRGALLLELSGKWNTSSGFDPLPMWGEKTGVTVVPNLTIKGDDRIELLRAVAKVDVTIDREAVPLADFTLQALRFYHWSDRGQLIPDAAALVNDPAVVDRISGNTATTTSDRYQAWSAQERDADGFFTGCIYVPETPAGSDGGTSNPALLIQAEYRGTVGWYKAEFLDKNTSDDRDRYLPLLRNYRYNAVIKGVGGRGYATPEEAYKSRAQNLIVHIHEHSDASLTNVMYDGQYWLAWDPKNFELDKEKHDADDYHNIFRIETNCEDGWRWTRTVDQAGTDVTWLTIPDTDRSGPKGVRGNFHFIVQENTGAPRTAFVHFTAGRMDMSVEVVQSDESNLEILLFDVDDHPLGDVYWVNTVENKIQERTIRVKWTPEKADLSVTFATDNYPGAVQVKYETGGNIPAGTVSGEGLHEYHLKLSELTMADDYDFDAGVIQPYRTRYTFTLDYHGRQITRELVIAHHLEFFHLYRYQPEGYLMGLLNWDQSLCFEASAPFIAELSNNHSGLFTFYTGTYGNFTEGFHTDYEKGKEGYFKFYEWSVTAKNPTPERKFQYETISITFPESELPDTTILLKTFNILPNCYITPPGTSVQVPVRNPWDARWEGITVQDRMPLPELPTTGNFTCELLWEDVDGLIDDVLFTPAHTFDPYRTEMTVKTNGGRGEGNAVVALRQNGVIIWSWHIWVTAFDPDNANIYTYNNGDPLYLMDRNLGATADRNDTEQDKLKSLGLYYQGGRKDPFPPLAILPASQQEAHALSDHKRVYPDNDIFKVEPFLPGDEEQTLVRTIENPTTFISVPAKPYDWYSFNEQPARWAFYHNDNSNPKEQNTALMAKNFYDPCPEGWIVPNSHTKAPWRPQIWGSLGAGGSFLPDGNTAAIPGNFGITTPAGDFYPASGYIDHTDGTYREVGYNVLVTSSHFMTYDNYNQLAVMEYPVGRLMGYVGYPYATGRNIRCMKIDYYKPEND